MYTLIFLFSIRVIGIIISGQVVLFVPQKSVHIVHSYVSSMMYVVRLSV